MFNPSYKETGMIFDLHRRERSLRRCFGSTYKRRQFRLPHTLPRTCEAGASWVGLVRGPSLTPLLFYSLRIGVSSE